MKETLKRRVLEAILVGTLIAGGCTRKVEHPKSIPNTKVITGHASRETLTDLDYDGKWDMLEIEAIGGYRRVYLKPGYLDQKVEIVDEQFFNQYGDSPRAKKE